MKKVLNEGYIRESNKKIKREAKEKLIGMTKVIIKDPLSSNVDLDAVFADIKRKVPAEFLNNVDYIMIGEFETLKKRKVNAAYAERAIYLTNNQDDETDIADDIVHEIAHAVEDASGLEIYSDGQIESEFVAKRERLFHLLEAENFEVEYQEFMNPEYSENFDNFLYHEVGYPLMANLGANIFYSPYAATSLKEYFANGFEAYYYHRERDKLASISPILFDKLENLNYNER